MLGDLRRDHYHIGTKGWDVKLNQCVGAEHWLTLPMY
jgi:hypothetical protein